MLAAGCSTDVFNLPLGAPRELGLVFDGMGPGDGAPDGATARDGSGGDGAGVDDGGDAGGALPASCAQLGCTPALNEGDVTLESVDIGGCHAYRTLTINNVVRTVRADGVGFAACAETIIVAGVLSGDGRGYAGGSGPGKGNSCGAGGSHGGLGADPSRCGVGSTYDDANLPRQAGSGGGALGDGGGSGGGALELAATRLSLIGFITASGGNGSGASDGGGAGGSVLIHAGSIDGAGQIIARGGLGVGLAGGGGGGGRVALYTTTPAPNVSIDVSGGATMNGTAAGGDGSQLRVP